MLRYRNRIASIWSHPEVKPTSDFDKFPVLITAAIWFLLAKSYMNVETSLYQCLHLQNSKENRTVRKIMFNNMHTSTFESVKWFVPAYTYGLENSVLYLGICVVSHLCSNGIFYPAAEIPDKRETPQRQQYITINPKEERENRRDMSATSTNSPLHQSSLKPISWNLLVFNTTGFLGTDDGWVGSATQNRLSLPLTVWKAKNSKNTKCAVFTKRKIAKFQFHHGTQSQCCNTNS